MTGKEQERISYIVLTGPAILIYSFIIIFPIVFSFSLSFTEWSGFGAPKLVGVQQYLRMLKDPVFYHGLRNNLLVVAVSVFGQIPLGFVLTYVIYRKLIVGGRFFESMIFLPITISAVVVAILWNQIFSPAGIYTALVRTIKKRAALHTEGL